MSARGSSPFYILNALNRLFIRKIAAVNYSLKASQHPQIAPICPVNHR